MGKKIVFGFSEINYGAFGREENYFNQKLLMLVYAWRQSIPIRARLLRFMTRIFSFHFKLWVENAASAHTHSKRFRLPTTADKELQGENKLVWASLWCLNRCNQRRKNNLLLLIFVVKSTTLCKVKQIWANRATTHAIHKVIRVRQTS